MPNKKSRTAIENLQNNKVDANLLKKIQITNSENESQISRTTRLLREHKVGYEWGAITDLKRQSRELDPFFTIASVDLDVSKDVRTTMKVVYCSDLNGLVTHLLRKRDIGDDFLCKIGVDGGGGSLKVVFAFNSVLFPWYYISCFCFPIQICLNLVPSNENDVIKVQQCSGINKLIILVLAPRAIESYFNLSTLFSIIQLNGLLGVVNYSIASDLKCLMVMLGLQSCSAMHPCPWCDVSKNTLDLKGNLRTFESIQANYMIWKTKGMSNMANSKNYGKLNISNNNNIKYFYFVEV